MLADAFVSVVPPRACLSVCPSALKAHTAPRALSQHGGQFHAEQACNRHRAGNYATGI